MTFSLLLDLSLLVVLCVLPGESADALCGERIGLVSLSYVAWLAAIPCTAALFWKRVSTSLLLILSISVSVYYVMKSSMCIYPPPTFTRIWSPCPILI